MNALVLNPDRIHQTLRYDSVEGAREHGLPDDYVPEVEEIASTEDPIELAMLQSDY